MEAGGGQQRTEGVCAVLDGSEVSVLGEPMSWEDFLELPEELRAEYSGGRAFVNPPAGFRHQQICLRLRDVLVAQLGASAVVAMAVGWRLPSDRPRLRIPDLMVLQAPPAGDLVTDAPTVVVEVVSTNRAHDYVRKVTEYLEAGAGQYWIVDPRDEVMDVFASSSDGWLEVAHLTRNRPDATFEVPPFGAVRLSLDDILL
jgi:Uma2 family endonuclease